MNEEFFQNRFLPTNCLSVFDHFVRLVIKGLKCVLEDQQQSHRGVQEYLFRKTSQTSHRKIEILGDLSEKLLYRQLLKKKMLLFKEQYVAFTLNKLLVYKCCFF